MSRRVVRELIIPKCEGRSFTVRKGQVLRVIEVDGPQAADMIAFNLHDFRESISAWLTRHLSGNFTKAEKIYSRLPAGNVMFTVLTDIPGVFWLSGGRCNRLTYEHIQGGVGHHGNCQDILMECIRPYGLTEYDIHEVLNIFMNAAFHEDGSYELNPSQVKKGDYVELLAEMDLLIAISACPDELSAYNEYNPKPLKIQILG